MLPKNSDQNWEAYGKDDPYFGVLSDEKFTRAQLDEKAIDEFFASGETHITEVLATIEQHIATDFQPRRCLDFGCGVGRLVFPLAQRFASVTGVDISPSMLAEARKNAHDLGLTNVELLPSDDKLSQLTGPFDLIHSFIVLQHIPKARGERILERLIELLAPNGVGALHFTYANDLAGSKAWQLRVRERVPLVHNLINVAKGRSFRHPYMMMETYDLNRLMRILQLNGAAKIHIELTKHDVNYGAMLYFRKESGAVAKTA